MTELAPCQCSTWPARCLGRADAEDLLCRTCRGGCQGVFSSWPVGTERPAEQRGIHLAQLPDISLAEAPAP